MADLVARCACLPNSPKCWGLPVSAAGLMPGALTELMRGCDRLAPLLTERWFRGAQISFGVSGPIRNVGNVRIGCHAEKCRRLMRKRRFSRYSWISTAERPAPSVESCAISLAHLRAFVRCRAEQGTTATLRAFWRLQKSVNRPFRLPGITLLYLWAPGRFGRKEASRMFQAKPVPAPSEDKLGAL